MSLRSKTANCPVHVHQLACGASMLYVVLRLCCRMLSLMLYLSIWYAANKDSSIQPSAGNVVWNAFPAAESTHSCLCQKHSSGLMCTFVAFGLDGGSKVRGSPTACLEGCKSSITHEQLLTACLHMTRNSSLCHSSACVQVPVGSCCQ